MPSFSYLGSGSQSRSTSLTTLTPALPSGGSAWAVGDALFLLVGSQTTSSGRSFTASAGWTQLGSRVDSDAGGGFARQYGSLALWWKVAATGETAPSVTLNSPGATWDWNAQVLNYRPGGAGMTPRIVTACVDDTTGTTALTSYTPPSFTSALGTAITVIAQNRASGGLTLTTSQSFATRYTQSQEPAGLWLDRDVSAGSIALPTLTGVVARPWMSKAFTLNRTPDDWGVDQIKW
jgi:hypothetical protein